jgi:hypothetical protein
MGNAASLGIDHSHVRIYTNLLQFNDHARRVQMLETLMMAPEYIASAKRAGLYAGFLNYIRAVKTGDRGATFPIMAQLQQPPQQQRIGPAMAAVMARQPAAPATIQGQLATYQQPATPAWQIISATPSGKALDYFQQCLLVLGIGEDDTLSEELLKSTYKKGALRAHPDKGGSEQQFEAVTRAFAYLSEILKRIKGTRKVTNDIVAAPAAIQQERSSEISKWENVKPVRLDPKNLNTAVFNQLYEQTRIPDPEDEGYGDWLKDEAGDAASGQKFSGKYNRDVFNKMFQDEAAKKATSTQLIMHPELMALNSSSAGVEIGRDKPQSYTAPANADMQYTDLRAAYTTENTISPYVANVRVEERNLKDYKDSYKKGPAALTSHEQAMLDQQSRQRDQYEMQRQRRVAQEDLNAASYHERMKRLALTN